MKDTSTRVFGLMCVLVGVWTAVYWLYEPGDPPVTFAQSPTGTPGEASPASRGPMAEVIPPITSSKPPPRSTTQTPPRSQPQTPPRNTAPAPQPTTPRTDTPKTRVIPPEYWEYTVQKGDGSMEAIARRLLGDGRLWTKIAEANPLLDARKLIPGRTVLKIPKDISNIQGKEIPIVDPAVTDATPTPTPATRSETPATPRETVYVVKSGDTLSDIARNVYGKSGLWRRIYDANRDVIADPDAVKPGTSLRIPPAE